MYEATVSICKSNSHLLHFIRNQIEPQIKEIDGITSVLEDVNREYFSLACADTFRFQIQRSLAAAISEAISLGYKNIFMRKSLGIGHSDFYQNLLVNTICVFDNEYDKQQVAKIIDVEKPLYIDGYCNFMLSSLERKWQEISRLVCENVSILNDGELITEFLQYLLESVPSKIKRLSVSFEENDYCLYNSGNKLLSKLYSLAEKSSAEEEAMLNIICLNPQSVKIYGNGNLSTDFCSMLDDLFDVEYIEVE